MRNKGLSIFIGVIAVAAIVLYIVFGNIGQPTGEKSPEAESGEPSVASVVINEVMANNGGAVPDDEGKFNDWLELYNPTDENVKLRGWGLSDEANVSAKWVFPDVEIAAKGYLVVFCSGKSNSAANAEFQHTNFKLKAGTDALILTDPSGSKMDMLTLPEITSNYSIGRSADQNEWVEFKDPTPGFENSEQGRLGYNKSMDASAIGLKINELQPSNKSTLPDKSGAFSDWIEIFNPTNSTINLTGFGLSDDPAKPLKWQFPEGTSIEKGQYLIVFASGISDPSGGLVEGQLQASFQLSAYSEQLILANKRGQTIDSVQFAEIPSDAAYGRNVGSGEWELLTKPSPGYENSDEGYTKYQESFAYGQSGLIISEAMLSNSAYVQEEDKKYYDWIELYNGTSQAVDLNGYGLSDNAANPTKWRFPSTTVEPGEYLIVQASSSAEGAKKKYLHTNFALSKEGTVIVLAGPDGKIIDRFNVGKLQNGMSYGRTDGTSLYYTTPSPGEANGPGSLGVAGDVAFDKQPGKYGEAIQVAMSAPEGSEIYYTTDGSIPTQSSSQYGGPIQVDKTTVVRACALKSGYLPGRTMTGTFFIDAQHKLPMISVSTTPANLFDPQTGIYMEGPNASQDPAKFKLGANYYGDTEIPASFEVYDESGKRAFNQDVAMKMAGGLGLMREQKSFALYARSEYGQSTMKYKFFDNRPFTEYKSLVLRQIRDNTKIKEVVVFNLVDSKMNVLTQAYKPYVVYINGKYWGVYYLMEKRNEHMIAAHENAENPDSMNIQRGTKTTQQGSSASYVEAMNYAKEHDMSQKENFEYVAARVDTDSFMDVMINQIYIANNDTYNMQSYQLPDGKWKQILLDTELTFYLGDPTLTKRLAPEACNSTIFGALLKYRPWKDKFIERFAWTLKEIYNPQNVNAAIDKAAEDIKDEIGPMYDRFGDTATVDKWTAAVKTMHTFANQRPAEMVKQLKNVFTLSDEQINMLDDAIK